MVLVVVFVAIEFHKGSRILGVDISGVDILGVDILGRTPNFGMSQKCIIIHTRENASSPSANPQRPKKHARVQPRPRRAGHQASTGPETVWRLRCPISICLNIRGTNPTRNESCTEAIKNWGRGRPSLAEPDSPTICVPAESGFPGLGKA